MALDGPEGGSVTDTDFRKWINTLPSCISGNYSEYVDGIGYNPACHVRRAKTSGTAYKAEYSCVPMTHAEHFTQHAHGEAQCLRDYLGGEWTRESAAEWFDKQAMRYRDAWMSRNGKA